MKTIPLVSALFLLCLTLPAQNAPAPADAKTIENGQTVFRRDCAFCHGRDAGGGESGPDLTRSKLVGDDVAGSTIAPVIRNGRPDHGMPAFHLPEPDLAAVVAFLHSAKAKAEANNGGRRGVDEADLQTGDAAAGRQYFSQACASCHSSTGDLAGIASRLKGLRLEQRMLYPRGAKSTVTVTLRSGQTVAGTLSYLDEFTVALRDSAGKYRSWSASDVKYTVDAPAEAHVELLPKYSDADVHNLMAYLQTLR
ncbi:MAG TPA: c-type cytochrome [Bryobacteraceae bacterium]|jgi:cytochrome c oxidase cbb3-type subunit 3